MFSKVWCSILLFAVCTANYFQVQASDPEEEHGVKYADNCEACKILAIELDDRLKQTGKSHDVIQTG